MLALFFKNSDGTYTEVTAASPLPVNASVTIDTSALATQATLAAIATDIDAMANDTSKVPTYSESLRVSATFNRPADITAYSIGDLVANSTTAGSVAAMSFAAIAASSGGKGLIRAVKIDKTGTAAASLRAHFWSAAPTVGAGDNAALSAIKAGYLGYIDVTLNAVFSDGAVGVGTGEVPFDLTASTTVYCLLEARSAFTPTSASTYTVDVISWPEA